MKRTILFLALATLLLPAVKLNAQVGFHAGYAPQKLVIKGPTVADRESASTLYHGSSAASTTVSISSATSTSFLPYKSV